MNIYVQLGKRIAFLKKKKKMSQLDLALDSGINKNYISDLERNLYDPSLQTIDSLAKALNIETYLLLKYDDTHKDVPNRI